VPAMQNKMMKEAENKVITNSRGFAILNEFNRISMPKTKKNSDSKRTTIFLIRISNVMN
jgi:hypothetical protein